MKNLVKTCFILCDRDIHNADDVLDMFLKEATFKLLHTGLELRVRERGPKTFEDLLLTADTLTEARAACRPVKSDRGENTGSRYGEEIGAVDKMRAWTTVFFPSRPGDIYLLTSLREVCACAPVR